MKQKLAAIDAGMVATVRAEIGTDVLGDHHRPVAADPDDEEIGLDFARR